MIVFSVLLLSAIAATIGTTVTTQIQPAYSQAQHCTPGLPKLCGTPGQDPTILECERSFPGVSCETTSGLSNQEVGQTIGEIHQICAQFGIVCDVSTPDR
jgi:hypothetical protein